MNNPKLIFCFCLIAIVLAPLAHADTPGAATVIAADSERAIESAYVRADAEALSAAVEPLDVELKREPSSPALLYTRAYGYYAKTSVARTATDRAALQRDLESAVNLLEKVKGTPWRTEAEALEGNVLGMLIGVKGGAAGMTLGPKSSQLLQRAASAASANPRVLMFRGIGLLNTPKMWGGDPVKALALLQQSVDGFAAGQPAAGPQWGHADALVWLGMARKKAGDREGARSAWTQALAVQPGYGWVEFVLLPGLEKKSGK